MSNMVILKSWIEGTRPLLWNAFALNMLSGEKKRKTGSAGNNPEEWKQTVLATPERRLFVKGSYLYSCLREAARFTKEGRGTLQRSVAATLQILDEEILVNRFIPEDMYVTPEAFYNAKKKDVYIDVCGVRNPATRGRNIRYRVACSSGWKCSFSLVFDNTLVSQAAMRSIICDAGNLVGLGDGRSIGLGRFQVVEIEEIPYIFDAEKTAA